MLKRLMLALILIGLALTAAPLAAQGGGDSCPALVGEALALAEQACAATGRNEACYGSLRVDASLRDSTLTFEAPADLVPVAAVESLHTAGLDEAADIWGVALLRVQADLPETLPGQNVTLLLLGDVEIANAGSAEASAGATCDVTVSGGANLRSGPGTQFNVVGGAAAGDSLSATGRTAAGDWLRVTTESGEAWLFAELAGVDGCDLGTLPAVEPGAAAASPYGPMQAFTFQTGPGEPACAGLPAGSLTVRSPEGVTVHLQANGVDIELGSTVTMTARAGGEMAIHVMDGAASVTAQGASASVPAGFWVTVPLDDNLQPTGAPSKPEPRDPAAWGQLGAVPAGFFENGAPLIVPEAGQITTWHVTSTILSGSVWSDTETTVTVHDRPMLLSGDGATMAYRGRFLTRTGEGTYHGTATWDFEGKLSTGTYDLTFTSATTFRMDWQVTTADRTGVFVDEATLIE